jgi:chromosome segregation ATPase
MNELQDLNVAIAEARKMASMFRAFEKIPRILEILENTNSTLKTLDAEKNNKEAVLAELDEEINERNAAAEQAEKLMGQKAANLKKVQEEVAAEKARLMKQMRQEAETRQTELDANLAERAGDLMGSIKAQEVKLERLNKEVAKAEQQHNEQVAQYQKVEADAKARAESAQANLEALKTLLKGGE